MQLLWRRVFVSEVEADHIVGIACLLDGYDKGFRGVEDVSHQAP